jgi:hypothetical protein
LFDDDVVTDRETEAGSFTGRLGREEGIEHLFLDFWQNAGAVVANPNLNFITEVFCRRP